MAAHLRMGRPRAPPCTRRGRWHLPGGRRVAAHLRVGRPRAGPRNRQGRRHLPGGGSRGNAGRGGGGRRRWRDRTPHATSTADIIALIKGMWHLAIAPAENGVEPKRVCVPESRRNSEAAGCPPWWGTAQRRFPQPTKWKAPLRSPKQDKQWRTRRNNIPPHAMRAIGCPYSTIIVERAAVGTPGNSMGRRQVRLLRSHAVRPRRHSPPKDDVEPLQVCPAQDR